MQRLLIISYDAVGDGAFEELMRWPNFAALARRSMVARHASTVFLSNTYPVHASVATGLHPFAHGLINNTEPFPARHPRWWYEESRIKAKTLWQAAAEKGLTSAAVMWPVTGGAKTIRWNIPELMAQPGQNQVLLNLKYGTKLLQLGLFMRHRHLLKGIEQPQRDAFATACMADILQKKRPDVALMHLTAYDTLCHLHGLGSPQLAAAFRSLDENLGRLLAAAGQDTAVILFCDHAQLPAETPVLPNAMLAQMGLLKTDGAGNYLQGGCFFECCGGSAFFHPGPAGAPPPPDIKENTAQLAGFARFLTDEEMRLCGRQGLPFGFAVKPGYACEAFDTGEKANHGYPLNYPHYDVFYMAAGAGIAAGATASGGNLLDIAPLAAGMLGLQMPGIGPVPPAFAPGTAPGTAPPGPQPEA